MKACSSGNLVHRWAKQSVLLISVSHAVYSQTHFSLQDYLHPILASAPSSMCCDGDCLQVLVQLKKFAKAMTSIKKAVDKPASRPSASSLPDSKGRVNLSEALNTDLTGIDTTALGATHPL